MAEKKRAIPRNTFFWENIGARDVDSVSGEFVFSKKWPEKLGLNSDA